MYKPSNKTASMENASRLYMCIAVGLANHELSVGRVDEMIVHSSGEKTVSAPMENIVASSP
jgi:hypothetical protein